MADIDLPIHRRDPSVPREIDPGKERVTEPENDPTRNKCELPICGKSKTTVAEKAGKSDSVITPEIQEAIDTA